MKTLQHKFVVSAPDKLEPGYLYVSMEYCTALHLCACGCGNEVITPIAPDRWQLTFNGDGITLHPSIGNWLLPCKTHYWIKNNQIVDAEKWGRNDFRSNKIPSQKIDPEIPSVTAKPISSPSKKEKWLTKLLRILFKK